MADTTPKSKDLAQSIETGNNFLTSARPKKEWMDTPVEFKPGNFNYRPSLRFWRPSIFRTPASGRRKMTIGNCRRTGRKPFSPA